MSESTPQDRVAGTGREVLAIAVTGALASALVYLGVAAFKRLDGARFVPMSRDGVWMSPLSYLIFFLVVAAPVAVVAHRLTRERAVRVGVAVSTWMMAFAILLPQTAIHRVAAALLAAGVAAAAARIVGRDVPRWLSWVRGLRRGLTALLAVAAVSSVAWRGISTRRAYAALPPLGRDAAPNVLLIILDTVRAASLSLYGYERQTTPNIDAFARRGVVFDWAISASPWTLPSHASMFTGQYAGRLSAGFTQALDTSEPTLAELFRARGYETVGFIANQHYTAWDSGLERGFLRYFDYPRTFVQMLKSSWFGQTAMANELYRNQGKNDIIRALKNFHMEVLPKPEGDANTATELTDQVLDWEAQRQARPFFAFLNYYDAHGPYRPTRQWRQKFTRSPKSRDLYESEIAYIDDEVGRLLRTLESRGSLRNTVVIITADHGEQFGEHKLFGHGNSVYLPLLHVPLVVVEPDRVPAGIRIGRTVSLRDLAPTIAALSGLDSTVHFPGTSLTSLWSPDSAATPPTSPVIAELYRSEPDTPTNSIDRSRQYAFLDEAWHFVWRVTSNPELYQYRGDVREEKNQSAAPDGKARLGAMKARLADDIRADTLRTRRAATAAVAVRRWP